MTIWNDRAGRFSPVKAATLVAVLLPALALATQAWFGLLGARAFNAAIRETGDWALRFVLFALAITPFRHVFQSTKAIPARRIFGVAAFAYAALHFTLYIGDQRLDLVKVASEIATRFYLTIGFLALLMFLAMASTSTDAAIKRMGSERWRWLHLLVFPAVFLGILHDFIQARLDIWQPVLLAGVFFWLIGARILVARRMALGPAVLLVLAVLAWTLAMAAEVGWFYGFRGFPLTLLAAAQFDFEAGVRPAWWVLAMGVAIAAARLVFVRSEPHARRSPVRT